VIAGNIVWTKSHAIAAWLFAFDAALSIKDQESGAVRPQQSGDEWQSA
jgi:hypothetical protein